MRCLMLLATFVTIGCATTTERLLIDYQFIDHPAERRIELRYRNPLPAAVCLDPESWPNEYGRMNQASNYVFLVIDGVRFPIKDFNTGYCPSGCPTVVAPGEEISVFIPYGDFGVPEVLFQKGKRLEFSPHGYKCPKGVLSAPRHARS